LFVSGDAIPRSKVWNAVTGALRFTLQGSHLRFSADGRLIATRFSPDAVAMFSADTGKTRLKVNVDGVYDVVFSPGGPFFVTTGRDATARLWSAETGKVVGELAAYNSSGNTHWYAVFQPDGRRVALAHPERDTVPIWDITGLVR
jgi:WD40 repeat protein